MDFYSKRSIFLLIILLVHNGKLTESDGCTENSDCRDGEYCRERRCRRSVDVDDRSAGYPFAHNGQKTRGYNNELEAEKDYDHEPTLEDRNLIKSLSIQSAEQENSDIRGSKPLPLPPIFTENWGKDVSNREYGSSHRLPPESLENWDRINNRHLDDEKSQLHIRESLGSKDESNLDSRKRVSDFKPSDKQEENSKERDTLEERSKPRKNEESEASRTLGSSHNTVLVKGEVHQVKKGLGQDRRAAENFEQVKDFFKSQEQSSIVDIPNTVKREEDVKLFKNSFVPILTDYDVDDVSKEEVMTNQEKPVIKIALLDKKSGDSAVHLKLAENEYSPEKPHQVAQRINEDGSVKDHVAKNSGMHILQATTENEQPSKKYAAVKGSKTIERAQPKYFVISLAVAGCVAGVVLIAVAIYLIMKRYSEKTKLPPGVAIHGQQAAADYQELCRQLRANQGWDSEPVKATPSQQAADREKGLLTSGGKPQKYSWSEEPVVPNVDISTAHVVLAYMEDHLRNKDRLNKEWEALCVYEAEPDEKKIGKDPKNSKKNRYIDVLPYDHTRVVLRDTVNATQSDYINASSITDHDPRNPAYIATQGPLAHTVSDFWQMVWEQGVVVIVNLTRLSDLGLPQCHRYWPEEGHETYHIYEVHLVSEHIWCDDYLVRSFYLKNLQTSETRTVTQFHFLSWPDLNVPANPKPLLEFRRKVNKSFRGRSCPIVVHCSGGVGRTGCFILIDMVLNKMMRGAKEIDIAATVEHLRDQRPSMVKTKAQFEFALTAVAEEVNAILQALSK